MVPLDLHTVRDGEARLVTAPCFEAWRSFALEEGLERQRQVAERRSDNFEGVALQPGEVTAVPELSELLGQGKEADGRLGVVLGIFSLWSL